jgi:exonuclease SbcC
MRILKIRFENINSLRGTHEIDFSGHPAFRNASLFAIVGPTGAGKTTLLDVITLTLYNRVPRLGKLSTDFIETTGALLTRDAGHACSEVTFRCMAGTFRAKWELTKVPVRRGERKGTFDLKEALELSDLDGTILTSKKTEVLEEIKKRVGLDYEQFVKAILLSQGDFAAFLKATAKERGDLLERITGTEIYRTIGRRAFEIWNDEKGRELTREREKLSHLTLLSEEDVTAAEARVAELTTLRTACEQRRGELDVRRLRKERLLELRNQLHELIDVRLPRVRANREQFEQHDLPRLTRHETLVQRAHDLADYQSLTRSLAKLRTDAAQRRAEQQTAAQNQKTLLTELAAFVREPALTAEAAALSLNAFRATVSRLHAEFTEASTQAKAASEQVEFWLEKLPDGPLKTAWKRQEVDDCLSQSRARWTSNQQQVSDLRKLEGIAETDNVRALRQETELRKALLTELRARVEAFEALRRRLAGPDGYETQLAQQREQLQKNGPVVEAAQRAVETAERAALAALEAKISHLKATAIPRLRSELQPGDPCAVCGSTHHPAYHAATDADFAAAQAYLDQLAQIETDIERREREVKQAAANLKGTEAVSKSLESRIGVLEAEQQKALGELDEIKQSVGGLKEQLGLERVGKAEEVLGWLRAATERTIRLQELEALQGETEALRQFGVALRSAAEYLTRQRERAEDLRSVYPHDVKQQLATDCDRFLQRLSQKTHNPDQYAEDVRQAEEALATQETAFRHLETTLLPALHAQGFDTIEVALQTQLQSAEYETLSRRREGVFREESMVQSQIEQLKTEADEKLREDNPDETLDSLKAQLRDLADEEKGHSEDIGSLRKVLEQNATNQVRHAQKLTEIATMEEATRKWRLLSEAIGDRQGKNFNEFAQRLTLVHLIRSANSRLKSLSERYLLLPPEPDEENLWVLDRHFDERRAVATLSGGETFLVSLALALGLSDLVSRNVKLESLFIDEGFGTLDPLTLDVALNTLERLQAESDKTIGIISHVEALKERIPTQIRLKKGANGYSQLEIVG